MAKQMSIQIEDDDGFVNVNGGAALAETRAQESGNRLEPLDQGLSPRKPETPKHEQSQNQQLQKVVRLPGTTRSAHGSMDLKANLAMNLGVPIKDGRENTSPSEVSSSAAWLDAPPNQPAQRIETEQSQNEYGNSQLIQQSEGDVLSKVINARETPHSRKSFKAQDPRVAFETFDSSLEERREEKLVFKFIQRMDFGELWNHLNATKDKFNVLNIFDKSGYSPLHYAAYKNIEKACQILIDFILLDDFLKKPQMNGGSGETGDREIMAKKRKDERRRVLKNWVNMHSRGDDGFTPLHFAAFHGNMNLIRLLVQHGADVNAQNRQGINMLHVSAQGDHPVSLAYFLSQGLDINSVDLRKSTPLHWAAFSGAELTLNYIIAWGGNLDAQDSKGLSPLHLAVKTFKENRSTKGIKQLLIKGANRNALDFETRKPVDYVPMPDPGERHDPLALETRRLLKDEWSIMGDCLMIKNTFKKQRKSPFTLICYFLLMAISFTLLQLSSYDILKVSGQSDWLLWLSQILFGASILLCVVVWLSDPGVVKKDESLNFNELLEQLEASSLCPDCFVIRTPRCRHCTLCQRCVDRYDHHCPWVNNCIGKGNFAQFYIFVLLQTAYLLSVVVVSILYFKLEFYDDVYADYEDRENHPWHKYRRAAGILMSLIAVIFMISVLFLCWLQTGNMMRGETTCERFSKTNYRKLHALHQEAMSLELSYEIPVIKRFSVMSIDDNTNPDRRFCGNILGMCCNQRVMSQREILRRTEEAYKWPRDGSRNETIGDDAYQAYHEENNIQPFLNKEAINGRINEP